MFIVIYCVYCYILYLLNTFYFNVTLGILHSKVIDTSRNSENTQQIPFEPALGNRGADETFTRQRLRVGGRLP